MPYLVDGYNLTRRSGQFAPQSPREVDWVVRFVNRFARRNRTKITVVFDGFPQDRSHALVSTFDAVKIIFAGAGATADDRIRAMIGSLKNRGGWTVVSSDRAVHGYARASGVRAMRSEDFLESVNEALAREGEEEEKAGTAEVEYWMEVFGELKKRSPS